MRDQEYESLLRHMEWADSVTWKTISALGAAQQDERLLRLLHHLHSVQGVYVQICRGEAPSAPPLSAFPDPAAVSAWARPSYAAFRDVLEQATPERMAQPLTVPWAAEVAKRFGSAEPASLGDALLQVVLHSTYHRGQLATRARELGATPSVTDYIAWVWMGRPEASW